MSETPAAAPSVPSAPGALRSVLKCDADCDRTPPASGTLKAVQIAEPAEAFPEFEDESLSSKTFRAGPSRRLSGRLGSGRSPVNESSPALRSDDGSVSAASTGQQQQQQHTHRHQYYAEKLLVQVYDWLKHEKTKLAAARKSKSHRRKSKSPQEQDPSTSADDGRERSNSVDSQSSHVSLDKLEHILQGSLSSLGLNSIPEHPSKFPRRRRANPRPGLQRAASSDTDYFDGDVIVPSCDAWLDNSKTLSYTGGAASTDDLSSGKLDNNNNNKDGDAWLVFKNEIIRIAHTLRLKGWRRIALGSGDTLDVERLSGALTNAVYVVTPPKDLSEAEGKKKPEKLLLRVYGPQVEHLIDRENELKVLQRLARKKIGPRLLGTFRNGRFEQYFNAITLTPAHLREPETSKSIAKRMRELHDGIDLLPLEREGGPGVWRNWDQWLANVARITAYLDRQYEMDQSAPKSDSVAEAWKANGYVCGVPWEQFLRMVAQYRAHLETCYKTVQTIKERLVFAHNDTQYGNILRIRPDDEKSPLLQPANKHKQLIVIDFEYAAANVPGLEFANHFTEWTYNYHDAASPHACNHERYPTAEEQRRFIKAYVDHRPQFPTASATPRLNPQDSSASSTPSLNPITSTSSIVDFMLDARVPPGGWSAAERAREEQSELQVRELMEEPRLWRAGNSAMWVAWGIVQARVPGLDGSNGPASGAEPGLLTAAAAAAEQEQEQEQESGADEFDYLRYAQDRAAFFWGDCVQLGLVRREDLPEKLRSRLKIVEN
ncbi:hypothetical protein E4U41_000645 [Claviceps citrina]|nr:hypothetical protein E4U41_000645 [Claviceps citrina]